MCKYCKVRVFSEKYGEKIGNNMILRNVDGSQVSEVYLNRYIVESDDISKASISIDISVKLDDAKYLIKDIQDTALENYKNRLNEDFM